jgi:predicted O-linked N-acetylglucosamine transferase (SPINDLY family)
MVDPIASTFPNLRDAIALHQQGKLSQAAVIYRQFLEIDPRNADALHLLGVIAHQTGHHQGAIDMIGLAIDINPNVESYHSNLGNALQELKQFDAAITSYDKAIALRPDYAEAYFNRGNALKALQHLEAAVVSYDKAILLRPDYAEAYSNRGISLKELKQFDAALASYNKAIALKPDYAEAYSNRGNAQKELKQFDSALASYDKAIALKPDYAEAHSNQGLSLQELKLLAAALASYDKAISLKPDYAEAYSNRGNALKELKKFDAALASYDKAVDLKPDYAEAYYNRGLSLQELKLLAAALASYDKAIALKPDYAEAHFNRGNALKELKKFDDALESYDQAARLKPAYEYLYGIRQHIRMHMCDWQNFESNVEELRRKIQSNVKASTCFPALALPISSSEQRRVSETWSTDKHPYNPSLGPLLKPSRQPKIRIGYYSADFHFHPVSILTVGLFELHDKSKFELIAFSFGPDIRDEFKDRITNAFDRFIDVRAMSDKDVAALSRTLEVDIAIDLGGHTHGCRTGIFSFRAAPVQLSYIGYLGTMGADYYDYLIADRTIIPVKMQACYREKIIYLPSYQVNDSKQELPLTALSRQELNLPSSGFVYCCFNANYKITPSTFDGWMRILKSVPESVLLLYTDIQSAAENLKLEAEKRGVSPSRLIFGRKLIRSEYLARCKSADLFLDTLPYNAGASASDALWSGLPVLTCMGESFASRVAASLLYAIGLPELVTETQADYEALAIELATDTIKLKGIKEKLERNRLTTPLFNTALFAKHIEEAYTLIYERHLADLPPNHIFIVKQ